MPPFDALGPRYPRRLLEPLGTPGALAGAFGSRTSDR